jgi:predicted NBD/HSP70 family sugar kinase
VDYLVISLTAVIGLLDPEVLIINGGESCLADLLIGPIKKRLEGLVPIVPQLIFLY